MVTHFYCLVFGIEEKNKVLDNRCFNRINLNKMPDKILKKDFRVIENQLRCPKGIEGIEIAKIMHNSNISMTIESINSLKLEDYNIVLEIGHGNCMHLSEILKQATAIRYFGIEISKTMHQEARRLSEKYVQENDIQFSLYNGENIPFKSKMFNKIVTVNTIYFWVNPLLFLKEIYRVLVEGGVFVLTFVQKESMKDLPFVMRKFKLFNNQDVKNIIIGTKFKLVEIATKSENVMSKSGSLINRNFTVITLKK